MAKQGLSVTARNVQEMNTRLGEHFDRPVLEWKQHLLSHFWEGKTYAALTDLSSTLQPVMTGAVRALSSDAAISTLKDVIKHIAKNIPEESIDAACHKIIHLAKTLEQPLSEVTQKLLKEHESCKPRLYSLCGMCIFLLYQTA